MQRGHVALMKYVLLLALGLAWSLRITAIKLIGEDGLAPQITFQLGLFGIAAMMSVALVVRRERLPAGRQMAGFYCISGLFGLIVPFLTETMVAPQIPVFVFVVIITTMPVWTLVLVALTGSETVGGRQAAGIVAGFVAAVLIAADSFAIEFGGALSWILFAFLVPICYAGNTVFIASRWPAGVSAVQVAAGQALVASAAILIASPFTKLWSNLAMTGLQSATLTAIVALEGFGLFLYLALANREGATFVAQANYVSMAFAAALGIIVFGDAVGPVAVLAAVLLIVAIRMSRKSA